MTTMKIMKCNAMQGQCPFIIHFIKGFWQNARSCVKRSAKKAECASDAAGGEHCETPLIPFRIIAPFRHLSPDQSETSETVVAFQMKDNRYD